MNGKVGQAVESGGLGIELERQLSQVVEELKRLYRQSLISVFLYGSASRGDFIPGRSDLNLLIIMQPITLSELAELAKPLRRWKKLKLAPLVLTVAELPLAALVFPVEMAEIRESGRLLTGTDPLHAIALSPNHVLAQCRRELYARLIRLRQEYLELAEGRNVPAESLDTTLITLLSTFRAILRLSGTTPPPTDAAVAEVVVARHHLDRELFTTLLALRRGSSRIAAADLEGMVSRLLDEIARVIALIDAL